MVQTEAGLMESVQSINRSWTYNSSAYIDLFIPGRNVRGRNVRGEMSGYRDERLLYNSFVSIHFILHMHHFVCFCILAILCFYLFWLI